MKSDRKSEQAAPKAGSAEAKLSNAELLKVMRGIHSSVSELFVDLDERARTAAQGGDMTEHAMFSRIAHVCAEFKHYLGGALDEAEARQATAG